MDILQFECKYCKKRFKNESVFLRHRCSAMERSVEIQTKTGQMAYGLYKCWLEKRKLKAPPIETFLMSHYYHQFIRFATYCQEMGIPDPSKYVEVMVQEQLSPAIWRQQDAYTKFLDHLDRRTDPVDQAMIAIETILTLAEHLEVQPNEVFKSFTVGEIIELVNQRRLTPWVLLCSVSFKTWANSLSAGDRKTLMRVIGVNYWANQFERKPDTVRDIKTIVTELGI